jgi:hypothetical protein
VTWSLGVGCAAVATALPKPAADSSVAATSKLFTFSPFVKFAPKLLADVEVVDGMHVSFIARQ